MTINEIDRNMGKSVQVRDSDGDTWTITITNRSGSTLYWAHTGRLWTTQNMGHRSIFELIK